VAEWLAIHEQDGRALPKPLSGKAYSGRFVLRVSPPVHKALAIRAQTAGKSLNTYCVEKLLQ
jgi:predicted HicB family RNase H-like nuclease